ncbi:MULTISPECIES: TIGR02757 family protein [Maribacter]|uniref:TIGR02757 family protein n=1 Tax=Maribacter flavus TaxID=1658664 RepID=A0A5B2TR78_9FLAO|nr:MULTISPECIES: TIGR02757 family protein [Maribacter]KAA2217131.1 TIGR02757 family protein [Maribacter flavus]MDC6405458.1 TIGR02757 family protein [Maribacter sp. PR66]MEE1972774.1 TIGR02757 family protein [Maribacter flavus]
MNKKELKEFLDQKVIEYNNPKFLESDPIQIPHRFNQKEDIEISGFLTATIAWGNRKSIINNAQRMMDLIGNSPYDFVLNHTLADLDALESFVHRTFNGNDLVYFIRSLKNIYENHGGLEGIFTQNQGKTSLQPTISLFKERFFELPFERRTAKHVSDPLKGSAAKRINMYLRWMVRNANTQVDFGLWQHIPASKLSCPLDVHSGNVARKLKLLKRKQNDAKALAELDRNLRKLDPVDPVKYDFALFGLGVFEKF